MTPTDPHELECALAAYAVQIERAKKEGNRMFADVLQKQMNELIKQHRCPLPDNCCRSVNKLRSGLTDEQKLEAARIGRIQFKSAGAKRER